MSPEQFVDNGFVSRPNVRVWPTVSSKTRGPFTFMPPSPLSTRNARKFAKGLLRFCRRSADGTSRKHDECRL